MVVGSVLMPMVQEKVLKSAGRLGAWGLLNLGTHFFLKALMNLLTMDTILTTLGNEYEVGNTM